MLLRAQLALDAGNTSAAAALLASGLPAALAMRPAVLATRVMLLEQVRHLFVLYVIAALHSAAANVACLLQVGPLCECAHVCAESSPLCVQACTYALYLYLLPLLLLKSKHIVVTFSNTRSHSSPLCDPPSPTHPHRLVMLLGPRRCCALHCSTGGAQQLRCSGVTLQQPALHQQGWAGACSGWCHSSWLLVRHQRRCSSTLSLQRPVGARRAQQPARRRLRHWHAQLRWRETLLRPRLYGGSCQVCEHGAS